ncbi:1,4-dihydroxy-2-naphthoate octaprenyltransferase [Paraliobacillus quinghaiensis]|uniref:1,4-dihydroxy-2-naphthoate octaprenyltransferase n=1 Tax=Paraliobacillus quinghaiensis TaxID=470815 RepID=A0A917TT01_9BACI|nr:1,4-dihydroxy-2-naphthoate polyprenyltransferase [Paraliobacillus quinghaiensis]GGM36514.1 1,4-dihydroxy-2-naphthoate octaprenyltransferase [Paraliobacillus quinghaiensis]
MSFFTFLKLVEIQTKIASVFPFLVGCLFVYYRFDSFHPINTVIFFVSMLSFDLTTTAINNYMDYRKASTESYRKEHNIIGQKEISEKVVIITILSLLTFASGLGIWLVFRTDLFVLLVGMVCFGIGIFYTFGPIPFSRMPLGELFSGVTMGFGIVFLAVYVNAFDQGIVQLLWEGRTISLQADILLLLEVVLISIPCMFTIANLMLANNICDIEEDIKNHRFTLPYYLGKKYAILLFNSLYILSFVAIIAAVLLDLLPMVMFVTLLVSYPVYRHVRKFNRKQVKAETFSVAVKNLVLVNGSIVAMLALSVVLF